MKKDEIFSYGLSAIQNARLKEIISQTPPPSAAESRWWLPVATHPGKELSARAGLLALKVRSWSPLAQRWRHRHGAHRTKSIALIPLVPRLLFLTADVGEDELFFELAHKIRKVGLVSSLFLVDQKPVVVSSQNPRFIAFVEKCSVEGRALRFQRRMRSGFEYQIGDNVILEGLGPDWVRGFVSGIDESRMTADVVVDFLGGPRTFKVPLEKLSFEK